MALQAGKVADAVARLRRLAADDPEYRGATIINIDSEPTKDGAWMAFDLDNGDTISLRIEVYQRQEATT